MIDRVLQPLLETFENISPNPPFASESESDGYPRATYCVLLGFSFVDRAKPRLNSSALTPVADEPIEHS